MGAKTDSFVEVTEDEKKKSIFDKGGQTYTENFKHFHRFAEELGKRKGAAVEILSMAWAGFNTDESRENGGELSSKYINLIPKYKNAKIYIASHSHGCNVANYMTHFMEHNPIQMLIHFAYPVRKNQPKFIPKHFKKLIYFHSKGDPVVNGAQVQGGKLVKTIKENAVAISAAATTVAATAIMVHKLGSRQETITIDSIIEEVVKQANNGNMKRAKELLLLTANYSRPIIVNGEIDHLKTFFLKNRIDSTKILVQSVPTLMFAAANAFRLKPILGVAARKDKLKPQAGKIIAGFDITYKGKKPDHSETINVVEYLPEIIFKTENKYPLHYLNSSLFKLDITAAELKAEDPVFISIDQENYNKQAPASFRRLADGALVNGEKCEFDAELAYDKETKNNYAKLLNNNAAPVHSEINSSVSKLEEQD